MKEYPKLLAKDIIERAANLSSTLLSDGMKELGMVKYGCMDAGIAPVAPSMRVVGTAFTVDTDKGDNYPIHMATYSAPAPGYVMIIAGKGYAGNAYIGGLIVGAAQAVGYIGMVVDGYVRDYNDLLELGLPVFARGLIPAGPIKKEPGGFNIPVHCGGLQVSPGDLVVGDADGVVVVPQSRIEEVFAKAEAKLAYEKNQVKKIAEYKAKKIAGDKLPHLAPQWVQDIING